MNLMESVVSIVKGENVYRIVQNALSLLGGIKKIIRRGSNVLIKPNLLSGINPKTGVTTNPEVLVSLIEVLRKATQMISIIESNFGPPEVGKPLKASHDLDKVIRFPQYEKLVELDVDFINLSKEPKRVIEDPQLSVLKRFEVPTPLLEADALIDVPVMKTHGFTGVSLGIKNLYGLIPNPKDRGKLHEKLGEALCDLASIFKPTLTLLDGTIGMEGWYACFGVPLNLNTVVAGRNVVAVDAVGAYLMGFDPLRLPSIYKNPIKLAHERGLGIADIKRLDIVGEEIDDIRVRRGLDLDEELPPKIITKILESGPISESRILGFFPGMEDVARKYLNVLSENQSILKREKSIISIRKPSKRTSSV